MLITKRCEKMVKNTTDKRTNLMDNIIIMSPLLKERFEKIKESCVRENEIKKPDNVTWEEAAFSYMLVVTEKYQKGEILYKYA